VARGFARFLARITIATSVTTAIGSTKLSMTAENSSSASCCCAPRIRYATYAA